LAPPKGNATRPPGPAWGAPGAGTRARLARTGDAVYANQEAVQPGAPNLEEEAAALEGVMLEAVIILGLIIANGFFACAEIAIISAHKGRIRQLAEAGSADARRVADMHEHQDRFLATVQVGITVVGATAAAVGGSSASRNLEPFLRDVLNLPPTVAAVAALGGVVALISYLSLVLGELVPKAIALRYPEKIALWVGAPMQAVSRLAYPFSRILSGSSTLVLKVLRTEGAAEERIETEEDIKRLLWEGRETGEIEPGEQELIHRVFEVADTSVREVMVPRPKICSVDIATPMNEILNLIAANMHARYPVYEGDRVCGILNYKDLLQILRDPEESKGGIRRLLHPPYFVPETMKALRLLKELQRRHIQMAVVVNEYGDVSGLVTVVDVVEELVGDIRDEYDSEQNAVQRMRDGSLVVDADTSIDDLLEDYSLEIPSSPDYETLGGFMLTKLQGIPRGGEVVQHARHKFTIVDMDGMRISKVKIDLAPQKVA
jgi:putative hemolysin